MQRGRQLPFRQILEEHTDTDEILRLQHGMLLRDTQPEIPIGEHPDLLLLLLLSSPLDGPTRKYDRGLHGHGVHADSGEIFIKRARRTPGLADGICENFVRADHQIVSFAVLDRFTEVTAPGDEAGHKGDQSTGAGKD